MHIFAYMYINYIYIYILCTTYAHMHMCFMILELRALRGRRLRTWIVFCAGADEWVPDPQGQELVLLRLGFREVAWKFEFVGSRVFGGLGLMVKQFRWPLGCRKVRACSKAWPPSLGVSGWASLFRLLKVGWVTLGVGWVRLVWLVWLA